VAGLELVKDKIVGKNVVCILSGSNNDITRLSEIKLRSLIYEKKEAYYMVSSMMQSNIIFNLVNIKILV
jgi:threonine dehydratase